MLMLQVLRKANKQVLAPKSNDNNSLGESLQERTFQYPNKWAINSITAQIQCVKCVQCFNSSI